MNKDKLEVQKQWDTSPCGTGEYLAELEYASMDWFDEIRRSRYEVTDRWMKEVIDFTVANNKKKLLEIGHGLGTDLLTLSWLVFDCFCQQVIVTNRGMVQPEKKSHAFATAFNYSK
jgi:hypothetical protein